MKTPSCCEFDPKTLWGPNPTRTTSATKQDNITPSFIFLVDVLEIRMLILLNTYVNFTRWLYMSNLRGYFPVLWLV